MSSLPTLVALLPALYLLLVAIPLTVIDLREHRLPNRLVLPVFPVAFLAQGIAVALGADWTRQLIAVAIAFIVFVFGVFANYFDWLGMGDAKLISAISLILSFFIPWLSVIAIGVGFALAFVAIIARIIRGKADFGHSIPLGPYLLLSFFGTLAVNLVSLA